MFQNGFYNPYMFQAYQTASGVGKAGLGIKGLFHNFNFGNFLNSAGKTLNVINQAIPIFYQVKPIVNNAKTMFRVMGAVRDTDTSNKNSSNRYNNYNNSNNAYSNISSKESNINNTVNANSSSPTFFL